MTKNLPAIRQSIEISKEEVAFWKAEVTASLKRQNDEFKTRIGYDELVRYFEALQMAEGAQMNQMAIVDEMSPGITSVIESTYAQNPTVVAKPTKPEADGMVQPSMMYLIQNPQFKPFKLSDLMQSAVAHDMKHIGLKDEMQLAVFDLIVAGFVGVEINHTSEPADATGPEADALQPQSEAGPENVLFDHLLGAAKKLGKKVMGAMTKEETEEKVESEVQNERIDFTNATYCKRWNPLDLLFDSRAVVFKDSRFIGKIIRMSIAEFNHIYPQHKGKITPGSSMTTDMAYQAHNAIEHKKQVTLYSLEIKKKTGRNCILVLANGMNEAVEYYEDPIITNGFKIKYRAVDNYGKIYPMSRAKKAKKPQDDLNHYTTIQFEHVDRAMRKIGVYMAGLTVAGQAAQRSSDVYAIVEKNTPQAIYEPMPAPSVVPENKEITFLMKDAINKQIKTTETAKSGKSDNEFATQDVLEDRSFQMSSGAIQDALGDLANQILDTDKDIIMQLGDGEYYFKVTGIPGGDQWYDPSMGPLADILVGDYEVTVDITTAQRPNPMKDRQDAIEYAGWITSPQTLQFAAMHGKRPSMSALNNVVKQFGQNPDIAFEDIQMMPGMAPGMPMPGNVTQVPPAGPAETEEQPKDIAANVPGL